MRILILNWRDIKNPDSGGAEILTHEMVKRWVATGHEVTQLSSEFPKAINEEIVDGVRMLRKGSPIFLAPRMPVHLAAFEWYRRYGRGTFDVVIDEIHGIPFFTPLYIKEKKVVLICEVAREIWDVMFPFPLNIIGRTIERHYFRWYQDVPFLTISASTRDDLEKQGIPRDHITVLPMGLSIPAGIKNYPKEKTPTLLFVGRIAKTKGVEALLVAIQEVRKSIPSVKLWIVGRGEETYNKKLQQMIVAQGLINSVEFFGHVPQVKKFELMSRAHILLVPSIKEGWGLIVPEAGYVGTPVVAYDVSGLRDVVTTNGLLVTPNPMAMAKAVMKLLSYKKLYATLQKESKRIARKYSWDETAKVAFDVLKHL